MNALMNKKTPRLRRFFYLSFVFFVKKAQLTFEGSFLKNPVKLFFSSFLIIFLARILAGVFCFIFYLLKIVVRVFFLIECRENLRLLCLNAMRFGLRKQRLHHGHVRYLQD